LAGHSKLLSICTATFSQGAGRVDLTEQPNACPSVLHKVLHFRARWPGWFRDLMWNNFDLGISCVLLCGLKMQHHYPLSLMVNFAINVPQFKELHVNHPNQPLLSSVIHGFSSSLWPFVHTQYGVYPITVDNPAAGKLSKPLNKLNFYTCRYK
jgi:hypothetical protein